MLDDTLLVDAIAATFVRRSTPLPTMTPPALSPSFAMDATKERQWSAFCRRAAIADAPALPIVVELIAPRLMEAIRSAQGRS
jgi:hypothetical protein